ncbi:hypothetical protein B7P43_G08336 [Cryptotermes secundus]|uniref:Uncharacterized protein n=1 Tax=Cryptotermes secundus TaxID=105785 RepID=A0A2J7QZ36_9NEOP|nr:hypothetical protein B7P43_G08336 [Cryptotermes secundus]
MPPPPPFPCLVGRTKFPFVNLRNYSSNLKGQREANFGLLARTAKECVLWMIM